MNRNQFISYLSDPESLSEIDSKLIKDIINEFPYFQTAHLLYTKSLHNQKSIHYNNQLKITAAYATNRKRLHQLITQKFNKAKSPPPSPFGSFSTIEKDEANVEPVINIKTPEPASGDLSIQQNIGVPDIQEEMQPITVAKTPEVPVEITEQTNNNIQLPSYSEAEKTTTANDEIAISTGVSILLEPEKHDETNNKELNNAIDSATLQNNTFPETEATADIHGNNNNENVSIEKTPPEVHTDNNENSETISKKSELEKEYLSQITASSYELETNNNQTAEDNTEVEDVIETNFVLNTERDTPDITEQDKQHTSIEEIKVDTADSTHSFIGWLKQMSNTPVDDKPAIKHTVLTKDSPTIITEKKKELPKLSKSSKELIDKFLKEEPRIKPKKEFFNPVNMAKQSVAEDITFVSETLAKIYVLQENYTKALDAYENLRLKYPEKRFYFAAQIKKLRKLIKQNNQEKN